MGVSVCVPAATQDLPRKAGRAPSLPCGCALQALGGPPGTGPTSLQPPTPPNQTRRSPTFHPPGYFRLGRSLPVKCRKGRVTGAWGRSLELPHARRKQPGARRGWRRPGTKAGRGVRGPTFGFFSLEPRFQRGIPRPEGFSRPVLTLTRPVDERVGLWNPA